MDKKNMICDECGKQMKLIDQEINDGQIEYQEFRCDDCSIIVKGGINQKWVNIQF
jgi:DNA-directed RNA polymerase subunit RPC12/RpoP